MSNPKFSSMLLRLPAGAGGPSLTASKFQLAAAGVKFDLEPLFAVRSAGTDRVGLAAPKDWQWYKVRPTSSVSGVHPWDLAHAALQKGRGLAAGADVFVEPDLEQEWLYDNPVSRVPALAANAAACVFNDQVAKLPHLDHRFASHLDDDYTQLAIARSAASGPGASAVRIAHLDTGYDPKHKTLPAHVDLTLQKNFIDDQPANDAQDPAARGVLKHPGHGTGTLGLLAGKPFPLNSFGYSFKPQEGGGPHPNILPVRVGKSVIQLFTSSVAKGIHYAPDLSPNQGTPVRLLSITFSLLAPPPW